MARDAVSKGGRGLHYALLLGLAAYTTSHTIQVLRNTPFAAITLQQTGAQLQASLARAVNAEATPERLAILIDNAVTNTDREMADALIALADARDLTLPSDVLERHSALVDRLDNPFNRTADCVACMWDFDNCQSISQALWCKGPVILTPVDDVFVLTQAGIDAATGQEVDQLDVTLAVVGLGATGLVLVSGGSSYIVKVGAGALKVAKGMGKLPPALLRTLREAADVPVNWGRVGDLTIGRAAVGDVVDMTRIAPLGRMAGDFGQIVTRTSPADGIRLLAHVDNGADMSRVARVTDAVGVDAPRTFEVLGKSRVFRIAARLSDDVFAAITGILLLAGQWAALLGGWAAQFGLRVLRRSLR